MSIFRQLMLGKRNRIKHYMDLNIVGSPTISNGVVSGFSSSDYLTFNMTQEMLQQYATNSEIVMKVNLPAIMQNTNDQIIWLAYRGSSTGFQLRNTNTLRWFVTADQPFIVAKDNVTLGTTLWIKSVVKNNVATLYFSTNGVTWVSQGSKELLGTTISLLQVSRLGNNTVDNYFEGSIDVNSSYIKLNGTKYIFTLP